MTLQTLRYTFLGVPFALNANFGSGGSGGDGGSGGSGGSGLTGLANSVYGRFAGTDGAASFKQASVDGTFLGYQTAGGLDFYTPPSGGGSSYTPPDWLVQLDPTKLLKWRSKQLAASQGGGLTRPAQILIIGDSTAQPTGDNWFTSPDWPSVLRRLICNMPNVQWKDPNAPIPFVGHGLIWQSENQNNTVKGTGWTQNPVQQAGRGYGPCGSAGIKGIVGTATGVTTWIAPYLHTGLVKIYFTCETAGASCDVVYAGAPRFTITPTTPGVIESTSFDMDCGTAAIGGTNNGAEFQPPTGTTGADVTIVAIEYAPDGFRGLSGAASWHQLTNGALGGQSVQTYMYDGGVSYTQMVDLIQPDLTIIALTVNDSRDNLPPHPAYTTGLNFMCDAAQVYGDVIFMTGPPSQDLTATQVLYQQTEKAIAIAQNSNFINIIARYGDYDTANANGYMVDALHMSPAGDTDTAFTVVKALFNPMV